MGKGLQHALGLYMDAIRDGNMNEALDAHLGDRYIQHSTGVKDGREGFTEFFSDFLKRCPERHMRVLRTIEDGDNCFVHVYQHIPPNAHWVTMDLFDTQHEDGRVIEHWDVIQAYEKSDTMKSGHDMIEGSSEIKDLDKTEENKTLVKSFVKLVLTLGQTDRLKEFVKPDLIQRAQNVSDGIDGLLQGIQDGTVPKTEFLFKLIGQGNFVVTLSKTLLDGSEQCTFDIYRIQEGLIAEHWSTTEPILPREQWANSGKF